MSLHHMMRQRIFTRVVLACLAVFALAAGAACEEDSTPTPAVPTATASATVTPGDTATPSATATATETATETATASTTPEPGTPTATDTATATETATESGYLAPPSDDLLAQFPEEVRPLLEGQPGIVVELLLEVRNAGPDTIVQQDAGGELHEAKKTSFLDSWEQITGWTIQNVPNLDPMPVLETQVDSGNIEWDYFEFSNVPNAVRLEETIAEKIDKQYFPIEYYPASAYMSDYAVDTVPYGTVLLYNTEIYGNDPPTSALDFYDIERFPGKRCIYDYPYWNMEWALLADGVPFDQVYDLLATEEGQERAFAKLSSIKDDLVFWSSGAESVQFILDGQCDIGQTWNGRPAARVAQEPDLPLAIVWKDGFLDGSPNGITKGTTKYRAALSLYAWESTPQNQCNMVNAIAYGNVMSAPPFPDCLTDFAAQWGPQPDVVAGTPSNEFWAEFEPALGEAWIAWKTTE